MFAGGKGFRGWLAALAGIVSVLVCAPAAQAGVFDTSLVSRVANPGAVADDDSEAADVSADGRFVAFISIALNLPDDSDTTPTSSSTIA